MYDLELCLVDPVRNRFRLYGISPCATLFGEVGLSIAWGRIGHKLRHRSELFAKPGACEARFRELVARRRQRGYVERTGAEVQPVAGAPMPRATRSMGGERQVVLGFE